MVHGMVVAIIVENWPKKPHLMLQFVKDDGEHIEVEITTTVGEMIGGVAAGARKRWEDLMEEAQKKGKSDA